MRTEAVLLLASSLSACVAQTWTYQGCYLDNPSQRTLSFFTNTDNDDQTIQSCTRTCASLGYLWAGVEYGHECYCDNQLVGATKEPETDCSMPCNGNSSQICGNGNRLSVYTTGVKYNAPTTNPGPAGWTSLGCYTDSVNSRSLGSQQFISAGANSMTVAQCTSACKSAGYSMAGLEYANQCFCDMQLQTGATKASDGCNMACSGNSTEWCGGSNRMNVYQVSGLPTTNPASSIHSGWNSLGCYTDSVSARSLPNGREVPGGYTNMTIGNCINACSSQGFNLAGIEYSQECYCGTAFQNGGACASDQSTCNMRCQGDRSQICGGSDRMNVYYSGSDSSIVACTGGSVSSSTSSSKAATSSTTSSSDISSSVTTSSASATTTISTPTTTAAQSSTTTSSSPAASTSTTTSSLIASSSTTSSSSSLTTTTSTRISSSTTTSATPSSTVCPSFWTNVVADLKSDFQDGNGLCNNNSRAAIRYAFHDAAAYSSKTTFFPPAAGGADGSLLLSPDEINRPDQAGLGDFHNYLKAKFAQYKGLGYTIGAADLIQVAGSLGVIACPGGRIGRVLVGRTDMATAAPDGFLPQAFGVGSDHDTILQLFKDKGFTARDLAALLGAHSTSIANFQQAHGIPAGTPQDTTPGTWDVLYYNETYNPVPGMARFDSDINLAANMNRTAVGYQFNSFVGRPAQWGASFSSAWQTMTLLGIPYSVWSNFQDCTQVVSAAFPLIATQ